MLFLLPKQQLCDKDIIIIPSKVQTSNKVSVKSLVENISNQMIVKFSCFNDLLGGSESFREAAVLPPVYSVSEF